MKIKVINLKNNEPHPKGDGKFFADWIIKKSSLHYASSRPRIREGEIWWAALGENIGIEINGKSNRFSRPILIFRKFNQYGFMGIPLTTRPHDGPWYTHLAFQHGKSYVSLSQARVMSVARLYERIGKLSTSDFDKVCASFEKLYFHGKKLSPTDMVGVRD